MTITEFIQTQILLPRLHGNGDNGILVVYDPDRRYRDLCRDLASDRVQVVDASGGSIESRAAALAALQQMGQRHPPLDGLIVYVPRRAPISDEEKRGDPFALYTVCGRVFPAGDGDEYVNLCLRARPDYAPEIHRIFAQDPNPPFTVIDAVGGGASWPILQSLLHEESASNLLFALLAPSSGQRDALQHNATWVAEARDLFERTLGLKLQTRAKSWEPIADELWRYLLFSEFVFDLPGDLPPSLQNIPRAQAAAAPLVNFLCDRLRTDTRQRDRYVEQAETIEQMLSLPDACRAIADLGVRDTFPFEERSFLAQAVDAFSRNNRERLSQLLAHHERSPWGAKGENQTQWRILQAAIDLVDACGVADNAFAALHARTVDSLIDYYRESLRDVDRRQREFEQSVADYIDTDGAMAVVVGGARRSYRRLANKVQDVFVREVERAGWPPTGRLANGDVFDRLVAPALQASGARIALFLIDALRYELGVELYQQLTEYGKVELQAACAQLPTVTPVGMASLLPEAGSKLRIVTDGARFTPLLGDQPLPSVTQRMNILRARYGQRFAEMGLHAFAHGKSAPDATVELLVIRSNEMDSDFESSPEAALGNISRTFRQVQAAMARLRTLGFNAAFVLTDHGFYLNTALEAGDVCAKPPGVWPVNAHERMLFGDGSADGANFVVAASALGIRGDFSQVASPKALVAYSAGAVYFHGGVSLQEALVPVLSVRFKAAEASLARTPTVSVRYKRSQPKITSRRPVFEVSVVSADLLGIDTAVAILLEAQDRKGETIGEALRGGEVDPATGVITLQPGQSVDITLKMQDAFEGKFTVKALDPTTLKTYQKVELETDYTV